jgi:hypothetical protein
VAPPVSSPKPISRVREAFSVTARQTFSVKASAVIPEDASTPTPYWFGSGADVAEDGVHRLRRQPP